MKKILSLLLICAIAFLTYLGWYIHAGSKYIPPHFHANFALYVDGERIDFTDEKFSEDIAGCSISGKQEPEDRVHLHERNQDTIHIHATWVSWWHFFSNNGIVFSWDYLSIPDDFWAQSWEYSGNMSFILNGKSIKNPFNRLINSQDKLLISYQTDGETDLDELYSTVSSNAWEYNAKYDPGSCWGNNENGIVVLIHQMFNHKH